MFHKLVVIAQTAGVEHLVVVHDDGIVQPSSQSQTAGTHHLDILGETKGARACNVAAVVAAAQIKLHALACGVDRRV